MRKLGVLLVAFVFGCSLPAIEEPPGIIPDTGGDPGTDTGGDPGTGTGTGTGSPDDTGNGTIQPGIDISGTIPSGAPSATYDKSHLDYTKVTMGVIKGAKDRKAVKKFYDWVMKDGLEVFKDFGFSPIRKELN